MIWDDLADAWNVIGHNINDVFYVIQYLLFNLGQLFLVIFSPLNFAFNFFKGFFDGINTTPPATAISWNFDSDILAIFNTIPYFSILMGAVGAGIAILILVWVMAQLLKL